MESCRNIFEAGVSCILKKFVIVFVYDALPLPRPGSEFLKALISEHGRFFIMILKRD